jgi:hypothetical protein
LLGASQRLGRSHRIAQQGCSVGFLTGEPLDADWRGGALFVPESGRCCGLDETVRPPEGLRPSAWCCSSPRSISAGGDGSVAACCTDRPTGSGWSASQEPCRHRDRIAGGEARR